MHDFKHHFLSMIKMPRYPEMLAFFGILLFFLSLDLSTSYFVASCLLLSAGAFSFSYFLAYPDYQINEIIVCILLCLIISILNFNYISTFLFGLLIFIRIMSMDKEYTNALIVAILVTVVLGGLIAHFLLPDLTLDTSTQKRLNFISLSLVVLVIVYKFYYFIEKVEDYQEINQQLTQRIEENVFTINKLSRFLAPQISQPIIHSKGDIPLNVERHKLTILFSDIIGFTQLSDSISPDELSNILNTYMEKMTDIAYRYGATLDKFMGDGLLCFFGDSTKHSDQENAILCAKMAIEMRREMQILSNQWRLLGFDKLSLRIGINTGYCHVGSFGSIKRTSYTLIGKEANLASRLESGANPNQILISDSTYQLIRHQLHCQVSGVIEFKGFDKPVQVWELLDPDPNRGYVVDNRWINHQLAGFNIHLNFDEIRNYNKQEIINHLNNALEIIKNHKFK